MSCTEFALGWSALVLCVYLAFLGVARRNGRATRSSTWRVERLVQSRSLWRDEP